MNVVKCVFIIVVFFLNVSCKDTVRHTEWSVAIDGLNKEAFDLRYKDIEMSRAKAHEALRLIDIHMPDYYAAEAEAWNVIAYSYFLTSHFDSTRTYLNKIRNIGSAYANKEIENAITYITEARLLLRECRYAEAFIIYDSTLTIFNGGFNRLKYNDCIPLKKYDHWRYNLARSDYLIGNAVLGYYYRDTELPVILKSLNEIEGNAKLHIDTTQLSILYYTYAGSYEKAILADSKNLYNCFNYIKKGLDILKNPTSRNNYQLANFYQITGTVLLNEGTRHWMSGKDSIQIKDYFEDFKKEYLIEKYAWDSTSVQSDLLPFLLLKKADSMFRRYDDAYQNLASSVHIGNYYLSLHDTVSAHNYYLRAIECDSIISSRGGYARIWTKQLYHILLKNISSKNTIEEIRRWYDIYSKASTVIADNTKRDYNTQRGKAEAEVIAKRSLFFVFLILLVCVVVIILLYFLFRQNKKLKKARSVLGLRNEELEENRIDLESLSKIGKHVVSTLEIDDNLQKTDFVDGIYRQIKDLKVFANLPNLSFILYIKTNDNELQRCCKEDVNSQVDISFHAMTELELPAVGCFLKYGKEVLYFNDWNAEYESYADKVGINRNCIDPNHIISGNATRSLAFINLYSKKEDKIGVLSLQTTELSAFKKSMLLASFEIIAEYVAAALDNAMQYQQLQFVQKKLIEQKRMELLTYVVRGISHELSQPLGSITQTLFDTFKDIDTLSNKQNISDEEYYTIVKNLNSDLLTISRSKEAISDLVNSFRNTIKENVIDPETDFNLSQKLDDIIKVIKPTIKSNINLIADCDPDMDIRTFPLLFSQVLTNLISNANQHAFPSSNDPNDTIRIICKASGKNLVLRCIDNGIGIPENEIDKLCQPFVSKKKTNLGLGLSLVKNIVEQYMKGEISFSSCNGLTVMVVIPSCIIKQ